jgi:hypothetical protein
MSEISAETAEALGWRGTARMIQQPVGSRAERERFMTAITGYAATLGLEVFCDADRDMWQVKTGTPQAWLAADKLCAYATGLADAPSNAYGQPWSLGRGLGAPVARLA